jgi:hypothetical protein
MRDVDGKGASVEECACVAARKRGDSSLMLRSGLRVGYCKSGDSRAEGNLKCSDSCSGRHFQSTLEIVNLENVMEKTGLDLRVG